MEAGQKSLLQTMLEAKSSIKNFLSFASKSLGLQTILMCSLGKSCHNFGKLKRKKNIQRNKVRVGQSFVVVFRVCLCF